MIPVNDSPINAMAGEAACYVSWFDGVERAPYVEEHPEAVSLGHDVFFDIIDHGLSLIHI